VIEKTSVGCELDEKVHVTRLLGVATGDRAEDADVMRTPTASDA
jgi:hypothetical protein